MSAKGRLVVSVVLVFWLAAARSLAADWEPIACVPADPPPEALFDVAQAVDDFESSTLKWAVCRTGQDASARLSRDTSERHGGAAALRLDYQFAGKKGLEYVQFSTKLEFPRPGMAFGFWMKTDGTPFPLRLRVADSSGETHQFDVPSVHRPGWQFVAVSLDSRSSAWGGDGNHRLDYPCRLSGICVDRPEKGFTGQGTLWVDDAALLRPRKLPAATLAVEVQGKRFGNVFHVGETVVLRAHGQGERIGWHAADFWGQKIAQGEGPATGAEARFTLSRPGYFVCTLELQAEGKTKETQFFSAAALPDGPQAGPSEFLGMCTHFGPHAYPLDCMELLQRYGMALFRDEISWGGYESVRGQYQIPAPKADMLRKAAELKMRPLLIFDYGNRHYDNGGFPNSPAAIAGFTAYAVDLVRNTRGVVDCFEVWNEWVGACGMRDKSGAHDGEAYGRLLRPVYAAIKQTSPGVTVVGIGGEYGPKCAENIVGALKTAGPHAMDAWSIHPYRYPRSPEKSDLVGEVQHIAEAVSAAGAAQQAWVTEIGWPTHRGPMGSDETAQAFCAVRALALLQSMPRVARVYWYDFKDDGLQRDYNENNFGVVHHQRYNCAPKPAIVAMSIFIRMTRGGQCGTLWQKGPALGVNYRLPDGKERLIAWSTKPDTRVGVKGNVSGVNDLLGCTLDPAQPVVLGPAPIYLTGQGLQLQLAQP